MASLQVSVNVGAQPVTQNFLLNPNPARATDILVVSDSGNSITEYNGISGAFVGTFARPSSPSFATLGSDGYVYATTGTGEHKYDPYSGYDYGAFASYSGGGRLAFADSTDLWVAYQSGGASLYRFNTNSAWNGATVLTADGPGWGLAVNPSDGDVYMASCDTNTIYRYAGADSSAAPTVTALRLTSQQVSLCLSLDGSTLYSTGWWGGLGKCNANLTNFQMLLPVPPRRTGPGSGHGPGGDLVVGVYSGQCLLVNPNTRSYPHDSNVRHRRRKICDGASGRSATVGCKGHGYLQRQPGRGSHGSVLGWFRKHHDRIPTESTR